MNELKERLIKHIYRVPSDGVKLSVALEHAIDKSVEFIESNFVSKDEYEELKDLKEDECFYVCPQHQGTGGYESCCACTGDRLCTEALNR